MALGLSNSSVSVNQVYHDESFRNFLCATGFSGHGIQQAPAVGRAIAELINYGEYRSLDLNLMNVDRVLEERRVLERNIV